MYSGTGLLILRITDFLDLVHCPGEKKVLETEPVSNLR
jgi:hypothetical protein